MSTIRKKNRSNRPEQLYQLVVKMLAAENAGDEKCYSKYSDKLYEKVEQLAIKQDDAVLLHALELCDEQDEVDELFSVIELVCEILTVAVQSDDKELDFDDALLVAIPMICPIDHLPSTLDSGTLNSMTKSIRAFGFIDEKPTVMMLPDFYSAQQLMDLPYTHRRDVIASIINNEKPHSSLPISPSNSSAGMTENVNLGLRFLVGVVVCADIDFGCCENMEPEQLDNWVDFVTKELGYKKNDPCIFLPPMAFGESLRDAINTYNKIIVTSMLTLNKIERHLDLTQCELSVERDFAEGRLLVTLLNASGNREDVVAVPLPSPVQVDLDTLEEMIADSAKEFGVGGLSLY